MSPRLREKKALQRTTKRTELSLSKRTLRGDLIEVPKYFFNNINIIIYVTTNLTSTTRNNGFKIIGKCFRSKEQKHFLFNRFVHIWTSLTTKIVNSNTTESFKKNFISTWHHFTKLSISFLCNNVFSFMVVIAVDYSCFLTFLYKFNDSLSIINSIASGQLQLKGG